MASQKICCIPACVHTNLTRPGKIFATVPRKEEVRKKWCEKINIPLTLSSKLYVCEDHFNIEEDAENLIYFRTMGGHLRMKEGALPCVQAAKKLAKIPSFHKGVQTDIKTSTSNASTSTDNRMFVRAFNYKQSYEVETSSYSPSLESSSTDEHEYPLLQKHSRFYLGIPKESYFFIKYAAEQLSIDYIHILITLKKIRLNNKYVQLSHDFNMSVSSVGNIFVKTVKKLSVLCKQLIFWPTKEQIERTLPIAFRARHKHVQSIIDCYEVEIEKPSSALQQAHTWSDYKHCNTIKYLISCTPSGFINFISAGFGGRVSDTLIVEKCGYLEILPNNVDVLADRGFKAIDKHLSSKNCKLIRPPSVEQDKKLDKSQVKHGRQIAALRIHVERVIRRVREFEMLKPHACINHNLIYLLDFISIIVAALVNLQEDIVKS